MSHEIPIRFGGDEDDELLRLTRTVVLDLVPWQWRLDSLRHSLKARRELGRKGDDLRATRVDPTDRSGRVLRGEVRDEDVWGLLVRSPDPELAEWLASGIEQDLEAVDQGKVRHFTRPADLVHVDEGAAEPSEKALAKIERRMRVLLYKDCLSEGSYTIVGDSTSDVVRARAALEKALDPREPAAGAAPAKPKKKAESAPDLNPYAALADSDSE